MMDLTVVAVAAIVVSTGLIGWDLATRRADGGQQNQAVNRRHISEIAHYVLFFSCLGLLLKVTSFAAVLLLATVLTGAVWLWNTLWGSKRRPADRTEPMVVELARGFFPVILIVFVVRSFLVEPFKIPSGSMIPTLLVGDFILVNKFTYGIRLPVANVKMVEVNQPQRGEVMVFRYPVDTSLDYIKRIVGLPGDRVEYRNKRLTINGEPVPIKPDGNHGEPESGLNYVRYDRFIEKIDDSVHPVIINNDAPPVQLAGVRQFALRDNCSYNDDGFVCAVPAGHYLMMGDNRDASSDSRYWGFVPEENIVGKAFLIWWNFSDLQRIGSAIR